MWFVAACASALFAGLVSIFVKCGVRTTDSDVATAIRTCVVLVFAAAITFITGAIDGLSSLSIEAVTFLVLSGLATGASWLCYFYAIQNGMVSVAVPVDRLSIVVSIAFSYFVLRESLTPRAVAGLVLIVCGTLLVTLFP